MQTPASLQLEIIEALSDLILDLTDEDGGEIDEIAEDAARDMATMLLEALELTVISQDDNGAVNCTMMIPSRNDGPTTSA